MNECERQLETASDMRAKTWDWELGGLGEDGGIELGECALSLSLSLHGVACKHREGSFLRPARPPR